MIVRGVRGIDRADSVDQHLDPFTGKTAQDGARCPGREPACRYARLAVEDVADLAREIALQFLALDHVGPGEQIEIAYPLRADDDLALIVDPPIVQIVGQRGIFGVLCRICRFGGLGVGLTAHGQCRERDGGADETKRVSKTIQHIVAVSALSLWRNLFLARPPCRSTNWPGKATNDRTRRRARRPFIGQQISGLSRKMERARRFERPTPTLANFPVAFSMLFDSTPKCPQISDILIIF